MSGKITPNDPNSPFKEKEKKGNERRSQLGDQWKVPMFGGQWKEKEKHFSTFSHFPLTNFT